MEFVTKEITLWFKVQNLIIQFETVITLVVFTKSMAYETVFSYHYYYLFIYFSFFFISQIWLLRKWSGWTKKFLIWFLGPGTYILYIKIFLEKSLEISCKFSGLQGPGLKKYKILLLSTNFIHLVDDSLKRDRKGDEREIFLTFYEFYHIR